MHVASVQQPPDVKQQVEVRAPGTKYTVSKTQSLRVPHHYRSPPACAGGSTLLMPAQPSQRAARTVTATHENMHQSLIPSGTRTSTPRGVNYSDFVLLSQPVNHTAYVSAFIPVSQRSLDRQRLTLEPAPPSTVCGTEETRHTICTGQLNTHITTHLYAERQTHRTHARQTLSL